MSDIMARRAILKCFNEITKIEKRLDALESAKCEKCKAEQEEPEETKDAEETPNASGIEEVILVKIVGLKK